MKISQPCNATAADAASAAILGGGEPGRIFSAASRRNPLETLDLDERIQGNPSGFLGKIWLFGGKIWPGFEKFGLGFDAPARSEDDPVSVRAAAALNRARANVRRLLSRSYFRANLNRDARRAIAEAVRRGRVEIVSPCAMS
ncbi:MAG TPA: hypothetical protein VGF57_14475 [Roseiarcus sp.]|jgi:hypothetical protein